MFYTVSHIFYLLMSRYHLWSSRLSTNQWDAPGDGCHSGHPEAAEDGSAGPTVAAGSVQRGQEECQTTATGSWTHRLNHTLMHSLSSSRTHKSKCSSLQASDGRNCSYSKNPYIYHTKDSTLSTWFCFHVCVQAGLLQWTRLFPSLRHRGQNHPQMQPRPQGQTHPPTQPPLLDNSPVAEEQVSLHFTVYLPIGTFSLLSVISRYSLTYFITWMNFHSQSNC